MGLGAGNQVVSDIHPISLRATDSRPHLCRTAKEHASYEKEIDTQKEKIERMKAENKSFHDIKQQVRRQLFFSTWP